MQTHEGGGGVSKEMGGGGEGPRRVSAENLGSFLGGATFAPS